jgi:hypothetical protein
MRRVGLNQRLTTALWDGADRLIVLRSLGRAASRRELAENNAVVRAPQLPDRKLRLTLFIHRALCIGMTTCREGAFGDGVGHVPAVTLRSRSKKPRLVGVLMAQLTGTFW